MPVERMTSKQPKETSEHYEARVEQFFENVALHQARLLYGRVVTTDRREYVTKKEANC